MALIELILRNTFVRLFSGRRIQGVPCEYSKNPLDPAATKRADKSVSEEYQLNQCHVEKWTSVVVTLSFNAKMVLANFECNLND